MKKRRLLAWLMTLVMMIGLMPATALADGEAATPTLKPASIPITETVNGQTSDVAVLSKTAEYDEANQEWDVTLRVDAETDLEAPPVEVVLVLDASNSMGGVDAKVKREECPFTEEHTHNQKCGWTYYGWGCGKTEHKHGEEECSVTRLVCMQVEAKKMISKLVEKTKVATTNADGTTTFDSDLRVAVVQFNASGNAKKLSDLVKAVPTQDGTNVNSTLYAAIDSITQQTGTYVASGLNMAKDILANTNAEAEASDTVKADARAKKIIVLLSDGEANDKDSAKTTAATLKASPYNYEIYSIGFKHNDSTLEAIASGSDHYYTTTGGVDLATIFANIVNRLAAMIIDPMGIYVDLNGTPGGTAGDKGTIESPEGADLISWKANGSIADDESVTITYSVALNEDELKKLDAGTYPIALNGNATFSYITANSTGTESFPVPMGTASTATLGVSYTLDGSAVGNLATNEAIIVSVQGYATGNTFTTLPQVGDPVDVDADGIADYYVRAVTGDTVPATPEAQPYNVVAELSEDEPVVTYDVTVEYHYESKEGTTFADRTGQSNPFAVNVGESWTVKVGEGSANYNAPQTVMNGTVQYAFDPIESDALTGSEATTVKLVYSEDKIGPNGPDGIPDKYQATVTFKVVNGTWAEGGYSPKTQVVTLLDQNTDGKYYVKSSETVDAPTGMVPNTGYGNGDWTNVTGGKVTVSANQNVIATHTFLINKYNVTVNYLEEVTNAVLKTAVVTSDVAYNTAYDVSSAANVTSLTNGGNTYTKVSVDSALTGTVTGDVVVNVYYSLDNWTDNIPDKYQVKVNYVAETGGSVTPASEVITLKDAQGANVTTADATISGATATANTNYVFKNWTTYADETVATLDGATIANAVGGTEYTFTAHFAPTYVYTLTYDANEGAFADGETTNEVVSDVTEAASVTLSSDKVPEREGYSFLGWADEATATEKDYDASEGITLTTRTKTVYAVWAKNSYNVTYTWDDSNIPSDVTLPGAPEKDTCAYGATYTVDETDYDDLVETVDGKVIATYTFDGWYKDGEKVATFAMPAEDVNLKGKWVKAVAEYEVTYAYEGFIPGDATVIDDFGGTYKYNEEVEVVLPTATGYTFDGWYDEDGNKVTENFDMPAEPVNLTGRWTLEVLKITFDPNGEPVGETKMEDQEVEYNVAEKLNPNMYSSTNYRNFLGWNTKKDGSGISFANEDTICVRENTILYAQWEAKTYNVYYNPNGGTGAVTSDTYNDGATVTVRDNMFTAPAGMQFAGWSTTKNGEAEYGYAENLKKTFEINGASVDLYAVWVLPAGDLKVTYHGNGGTDASGNTAVTDGGYVYGTNVTVKNNMFTTAPEDMKFAGWALNDPEATSLVQPGEFFNLKADADFYAIWTPLELTEPDKDELTGSRKEALSFEEARKLDLGFIAGLMYPESGKIVMSAEELAEVNDFAIAYKITVEGDPYTAFRVVEDSIVTWVGSTVDATYDTEMLDDPNVPNDRRVVSTATGRLDENGEAVLYCVKTFDAADVADGKVANTATIVNESDPDNPDFTVEEKTEIKTEGVSVTKTLTAINGKEFVEGDKAENGDTVTYAITVKNLGNETAYDLFVKDTPGAGLENGKFVGLSTWMTAFEEPVVEEPVVEEPVVEEPVVEEPVVEEPVVEEPVVEEPVVEEPVVEEPVVEEPVVEEPVVEEPVVEEPVVEEPVVEEPVVEEPVVTDPATEPIVATADDAEGEAAAYVFNAEYPDVAYIPKLAAGESITLTFEAKIDVDEDDFTNEVAVRVYDDEGDFEELDKAKNTEVTVDKKPSIDIEKELVGSDRVSRGDRVIYKITVKNTGNVTLRDVTVDEDPGKYFEDGYFCDKDGDKVQNGDGDIYEIGRMTAGDEEVLYYSVKVASDAPRGERLENEVTVTTADKKTDSDKNDDAYVPKKSGGSSSKKDKEIVAGDVEEILNTEDHFQYVQGYPDGTVGPERNITRAEATVIFFRLLQDHVRAELLTAENEFPDVKLDDWFNLGVSTMEAGGFVSGYEDGYFRPNGKITRAELATIISNFDDLEPATENKFADVEGHWAEKYVNSAAAKGWISGYDDGLFRPNQYITRAETMSMINRVLNRRVDEDGLHADAKQWRDNVKGQWYYYAVLEATNHHDYQRADVKDMENWTAINPNKVWEN